MSRCLRRGSSEEVCLAGLEYQYHAPTHSSTWALQSKQPEDVEQMLITEYDQRGTLGEGYLGKICDKKVPVKLKNKLYKTVIRPTLIYMAVSVGRYTEQSSKGCTQPR